MTFKELVLSSLAKLKLEQVPGGCDCDWYFTSQKREGSLWVKGSGGALLEKVGFELSPKGPLGCGQAASGILDDRQNISAK